MLPSPPSLTSRTALFIGITWVSEGKKKGGGQILPSPVFGLSRSLAFSCLVPFFLLLCPLLCLIEALSF